MAKSSPRNKGKTDFVHKDTNGTRNGPPANGTLRRSRAVGRHGSLEELEGDIDRLLFKVMGLGGLAGIEASLRHTRRLLYAAIAGK